MSTLNIAVATPSGETWTRAYGLSLVMMTIACLQKAVPGYDKTSLKILNQVGSILPQSRQSMVQKAIESGCSHILFIVSDQGFPAWTVHALARHGKLVVGANIPVKTLPSKPTARAY